MTGNLPIPENLKKYEPNMTKYRREDRKFL